MRTRRGHAVRPLLCLVGLIAVVGGGVLPSTAGTLTAASASLTMTSDAGDYIGHGQQYSYSTGTNDVFNSTGGSSVVEVNATGANGDWWTLDFAAPAGQSLSLGTYSGATRYPFQGSGAGLSVYGMGRGCNTLTGSFTVSDITFGPNNHLQSFAASFEQHCEGLVPALRGQVNVVNPPAAQPLQIGLGLDTTGTADRSKGTATVGGTVTCNQTTTVSVAGTLNQRVNRSAVAIGSFSIQVACSATPKAWRATVFSGNGVPFTRGSAQLDATASGYDAAYGQQVTTSRTATVQLTR